MRRIGAQRELERIQASGVKLSADAIYDLTLAATDDKRRAEEAMKQLIAARLRRNEDPG